MSVEEDCPICDSSQHAKEQIDEHTENGTLSEIRMALQRPEAPTE